MRDLRRSWFLPLCAGLVLAGCGDSDVIAQGTAPLVRFPDAGAAGPVRPGPADPALAACGDGEVSGPEQCEPPGTPGCSATCRFRSLSVPDAGTSPDSATAEPPPAWGVCGDGEVEAREECDDGNRDSEDGCSSDCRSEQCGNGRVDPGETCDRSDATCIDCQTVVGSLPGCGNGETEGDEECDDANRFSGDGCSARCRGEWCGNLQLDRGVRDGQVIGEECDPPAAGYCDDECRLIQCGDGRVSAGEECDDDNLSPRDGCSPGCRLELCGDGFVNQAPGVEDCEPRGIGRCDDGCRWVGASCGDGDVLSPEECDDGNSADGDGCSAACRSERCGNGRVESPEQCEPPGTASCDASCRMRGAPVVLPVSAADFQLENAGFDGSLEGWSFAGASNARYSALDVNGAVGSGSAELVVSSAGSTTVLGQCVRSAPGVEYDLSLLAALPVGAAAAPGTLQLVARFHAGPDCLGAIVGGAATHSALSPSSGWSRHVLPPASPVPGHVPTFVAPPAAGSLEILIGLQAQSGQSSARVLVDAVRLVQRSAARCGDGVVQQSEQCEPSVTPGCSASCRLAPSAPGSAETLACRSCIAREDTCIVQGGASAGADLFAACYALEGVAQGGPAAGTPHGELCGAVVECMMRTGCASETRGASGSNPAVCYCGKGLLIEDDLLTARDERQDKVRECRDGVLVATGPCRTVFERAAEALGPGSVLAAADPAGGHEALSAAVRLVTACGPTPTPPPSTSVLRRCAGECTPTKTCNNGVVEPGEACDPGDPAWAERCHPEYCTILPCGNGLVDRTWPYPELTPFQGWKEETCDVADPYTNRECDIECQIETECGDGRLSALVEACDPGAGGDWTNCCRGSEAAGTPAFGDCDQNADGEIGKAERCQIPSRCGDGERTGTEECDFAEPRTPGEPLVCSDSCRLTDPCTECSRRPEDDPEGGAAGLHAVCFGDAVEPRLKAGCFDVLDCVRETGCADGSPLDCLCGALGATACINVNASDLTGACKNVLIASSNCAELPAGEITRCVIQHYTDYAFSGAGAAMALVEHRWNSGCEQECYGAP
jgi:cysteine-rich repeat protein